MQVNLPWRGVDKIDSANDFGDALLVIIDNDRQMIGDKAVPSLDHEIAGFAFKTLGHRSLQGVLEANGVIIGSYANCEFTRGTSASASAGINRAQRTSRCFGKVPAGAIAGVGKATIQEFRN